MKNKFFQIIDTKIREKYKDMFNSENELEEFLESLKRKLMPSIRINTIKIKKEIVIRRLREREISIKKIPWVDYGFWIDVEKVGNLIEHSLGYIYAQGPASMIPPLVLNPKKDDLVLDLTAAPGSKTSQIAQIMNNEGIIFANDISADRVNFMISNLQRLGVKNVVVTRINGRFYHNRIKIKFDKVLLDAPCSGEGHIPKDFSILNSWGEKICIGFSKLQISLINAAFNCLKEGGILVYSTCTFDPRENELVISWLLEKYENAKLERIKIDGLKYCKGLEEWKKYKFNSEVKKAIRIYPHLNNTEGFFIAKIKKI